MPAFIWDGATHFVVTLALSVSKKYLGSLKSDRYERNQVFTLCTIVGLKNLQIEYLFRIN